MSLSRRQSSPQVRFLRFSVANTRIYACILLFFYCGILFQFQNPALKPSNKDVPIHAISLQETPSAAVTTSKRRRLQDLPIIYTYFEPLSVLETGLTEVQAQEILDFWKETWSQAGWEPRVWTWKDRNNNAASKGWVRKMAHKLQRLDLNALQRVNFQRWIVMTANLQNGTTNNEDGVVGWMSDWDVHPLHSSRSLVAESQQQFTVWDYYPTLVSGNATEWARVVKGVMEHALAQRLKFNRKPTPPVHTATIDEEKASSSLNRMFWSDSLTIRELKTTLQSRWRYQRQLQILWLNSMDIDDCEEYAAYKGVHFGYQVLLELESVSRTPSDRLYLARDWWNRYVQACRPFAEDATV